MTKVRVHELAAELGVAPDALLEWLQRQDKMERTATSIVRDSLIPKARDHYTSRTRGQQRTAHLHQERLSHADPRTAATAQWLMQFSPTQRAELRQRITAGKVPPDDAADLTQALSMIIEPPAAAGGKQPTRTRTRPAPPPRQRPDPRLRDTIQREPDPLDVRVALELFRIEVDALTLRLGPGVLLRVDKVADPAAPFWVSLPYATATSTLIPDPERWQTLQDWTLPLVPLTPDAAIPQLAVRRVGDERSAAALARDLHERTGRPRLPLVEPCECDPVEFDRRIGLAPVRRRPTTSSPAPTGAYCRRCGMPLTDPTSIAIGYGPGCLERLGRTAKREVLRSATSTIPIAAPTPKQWLTTIIRAYPDLRRP